MSNCKVCGTVLNTNDWRDMCYSCYKKTILHKKGTITDIMARRGENSTAGRKKWKELGRLK